MKEQKTIRVHEYMKGLFIIAFLVLTLSLTNATKAEASVLKTTQKTLYVGDQFQISDVLKDDVSIGALKLRVVSGNEVTQKVNIFDSNVVEAKEAGTVTIEVYDEKTKQTQDTFFVTVVNAEQIEAGYGAEVILSAWNYYDTSEYEYSFEGNSVKLMPGSQKLLVIGLEKTDILLNKKGEKEAFKVAEVTVRKPEFAEQKVTRAVGSASFIPGVLNFSTDNEFVADTKMVFSVDDSTKAFVSGWNITVLSLGTTRINAAFYAKNGDVCSFSTELVVTDPRFEEAAYAVAVGTTKLLPITGIADSSVITPLAAADSTAHFTMHSMVYGDAEGNTVLSVDVDGRILTVDVIVTNPEIETLNDTLVKGNKKTIEVTGIDEEYSTITYQSSDNTLATVSEDGEVKAKKAGTVSIYVEVDGKIITVQYIIDPKASSKAGQKAAKKAIAISKTKTKYSQIKRMQKKYYDCSSLVSRVYRLYKVYFGVKSGWSPTAAAIGQWCTSNDKVIAEGAVSSDELEPGDLIFYSYKKNGRYKNISHIEIYVGDGMSVAASSSKNRVVHYTYKKASVVMVARPAE